MNTILIYVEWPLEYDLPDNNIIKKLKKNHHNQFIICKVNIQKNAIELRTFLKSDKHTNKTLFIVN